MLLLRPIMIERKIIAIVGGSGSGKTTYAEKLKQAIDDHYQKDVSLIIGQDNYYYNLEEQKISEFGINFDHPESLDFQLLKQHLLLLKSGSPVEIPQYDYKKHTRYQEGLLLKPKEYIVVDGTLLLSQNQLRDIFDHSIFIDINEETRYSRRLLRDTAERGRNLEGINKQFRLFVKPMHDTFVQPSLAYAEMVFNCNETGIGQIPSLIQKWHEPVTIRTTNH